MLLLLLRFASSRFLFTTSTAFAMTDSLFQKMGFAACSCVIAGSLTFPIDTVKTRLQLQGAELALKSQLQQSLAAQPGSGEPEAVKYRGFLRSVSTIVRQEGVQGLYKGISPALLREALYASLRLGTYDSCKAAMATVLPSFLEGSFLHKASSGAASGLLAVLTSSWTDVIKIRMQADEAGRRYRTLPDALVKIYAAEGVRGLYKGLVPNMQRAAVLSAAQLATYDHVKGVLRRLEFTEGVHAYILASFLSGCVTTVVVSPIEVARTRIMNSSRPTDSGSTPASPATVSHDGLAATQRVQYSGTVDCLVKTFRMEGLRGLYKGAGANILRIAPHTTLTFVIFEKLREMFGLDGI